MPRKAARSAILFALAPLVALVLIVPAAHAQSTGGGIAGVVRDATGAVLPGVTVEAASPALIEKSRTVLTDAQGNYKLVDIRPGTYTVTFTLQGFGTVRREGIEITTGFTATANADLRVGALEETVTVTGASPIVDVQNVRTQSVLSREQLDVLPTSRTVQALAALTLGASLGVGGAGPHDVGGARGEGSFGISIHGARANDHHMFIDGMSYAWSFGVAGGAFHTYAPNQWITQEVTLETAGMSADTTTAGIQVNYVPKDGGNTFRGVLNFNYTDEHLQTDNLDDELRARGLTSSSPVRRIYDLGVGLGGRIVRDRLWFYAAQRKWQASSYAIAGVYFNSTPHSFVYTPDPSRPMYSEDPGRDTSVRVTWQAARNHKISGYQSYQSYCLCFRAVFASPEALWAADTNPTWLTQGAWTYTATNRLLIQAGLTNLRNPTFFNHHNGASDTDVPIIELSNGFKYNAVINSTASTSVTDYGWSRGDQWNSRFSVSYVTGSHAFKTGFQNYHGVHSYNPRLNEVPGLGPVAFQFLNQRPSAVTYYASPLSTENAGHNVAFYGQDQWTLRRLTLNMGLRFDYNHQWVPEQTTLGGRYYPSAHFDEVDVNTWKDISPRIGAAYDLFGDARTAVKGSIGRYVIGDATQLASANNPAYTIVTAATRTWNDGNGDYFPQTEELGPLSNAAFGTSVIRTRYDPAILRGWHVRPYDWQASASLTHELRPGLGLMVGYFRTWYGNFTAIDNVLVTAADFDPYCIITPVDARLPGGGGQQVCGFYDVKPSKFGQTSNLVTAASTFGKQTEVYNGVDVGVNLRFGQGGLLAGGISTATTHTNTCFVVDSPQQLYQCDQATPWIGQTQLKLNGSYPLPWGLKLSGVLQNLPGFAQLATLVATNAMVAPSLGRNLGACGAQPTCTATVTIGTALPANAQSLAGIYGIIPPMSQFEDRLTQVDLRFTRVFGFGGARLQAQVDLYNAFNANTVLTSNAAYGPAWLRPTQILPGRFVKFGAQLDF